MPLIYGPGTVTIIEEILDVELGDERLHVVCCVQDRFFCGRDYHPEASYETGDDRDDCCKPCLEISDGTWCPPMRPTHSHCPVPGPMLGAICPKRA